MTFYRSIMGFIMPALVNTEEFHNFAAPSGEHRFIALLDGPQDTLKLFEEPATSKNKIELLNLAWVTTKDG